jgi:hypothetical protein
MKIKLIILAALMLTVASCEFGDLNVDPNNPTPDKVPLSVMLPAAEASAAYNLGGRSSWYTGMFTAHLTGVNAQPGDFANYNISESDVDGLWRDYYASVLSTLDAMVKKAGEQQSPHYAGVAKVLKAHTLGVVTSFWGDIPYSDALKADLENTTPQYDKQDEIYSTIQTLLTEAISDLGATNSILSPSSDDLFYNGNRNLWIKAAYGLKARYFMHTFNVDGTAAANSALTNLANSFVSNSEQMTFEFGNTQTDASPWYQLNQDRPDVRVNDYFLNVMNTLGDPRFNQFTDDRGEEGFFVGEYFSAINGVTPFISYAEVKFIEAEARVRTGAAGAQAALQAAIQASLEDVTGSNNATYVTTNGTLSGNAAQQLTRILTQKHIALFTQCESWVDWRRTGIPALTPVSTAVINAANPNGEIPRRLAYPISERLFNSSNIPSSTPSLQTPKMYWDTID